MSNARRDGLYLIAFGSLIFIFLGIVLQRAATPPLVDFRMMYYPARCLLQHCDPYKESDVLRVFQNEGGDTSPESERVRQVVTTYVYLPTAFTFTVPFAMLPWKAAQVLWTALIFASLIFASFLTWDLGARYDPIVSGALIGFLLANSEVLAITGTVAGICISLCVISVWCFLRERFIPAGIVCLAVSLLVKPQDVGLIWLYFLLAGGVYRKRALQTLIATAALGLPSVLWVWRVAPNWVAEFRSNMDFYFAPGGINAPGLGSAGAHGLAQVVSLQAIVAVFRDDPRFFNFVSYMISAPLLLVWALTVLRSRPPVKSVCLALAAIASLSMLPVYHRVYDTKLLLLTVPACAILWSQGGRIGKLALVVNATAFALTGDLVGAVLLAFWGNLHTATRLSSWMAAVGQVFPVPLILLVSAVFFLVVFCTRDLSKQSRGSISLPERI